MENNKLPNHIAYIVDGNRRWAKNNNKPQLEGHKEGFNNLKKVLERTRELGIKAATFWVFSTENWKRSKFEVDYLFNMFREKIDEFSKEFEKEETRFIHLGRKTHLPEDILKALADLEERTKDFTRFTAALAMDYGGHDEIVRTVKKMNEKGIEITAENIEENLDTAEMPKIDFIIRTGGERRLSGFLSWQTAYTELYFPKKFFPEFTKEDLDIALEDFSKRNRRFGGDAKKK